MAHIVSVDLTLREITVSIANTALDKWMAGSRTREPSMGSDVRIDGLPEIVPDIVILSDVTVDFYDSNGASDRDESRVVIRLKRREPAERKIVDAVET